MKVKVYRNLNNGLISIQKEGLVVGHCSSITLKDVNFKVNQGGRSRVIAQQCKNVHAYAIGSVVALQDFTSFKGRDLTFDKNPVKGELEAVDVTYNPYKYSTFVDESKKPIHNCDAAIINRLGKIKAYTYK